MAYRLQLEAAIGVDVESKAGAGEERTEGFPGGMGIALAVVGKEQVAQRLSEGAQQRDVAFVQRRRQPVSGAPGPGVVERIELVGTARKIDRIFEKAHQIERAGRPVGRRCQGRHDFPSTSKRC